MPAGLAGLTLGEPGRKMGHASERRQFGQRIGDFQLVQAMLADSQAERLAGWAMVQERAPARPYEATTQIQQPLVGHELVRRN